MWISALRTGKIGPGNHVSLDHSCIRDRTRNLMTSWRNWRLRLWHGNQTLSVRNLILPELSCRSNWDWTFVYRVCDFNPLITATIIRARSLLATNFNICPDWWATTPVLSVSTLASSTSTTVRATSPFLGALGSDASAGAAAHGVELKLMAARAVRSATNACFLLWTCTSATLTRPSGGDYCGTRGWG
jgi:hypothetical protein